MNYIIGDSIRKKIQEKGITFVAFAEKFGVTDRNLQHVFKKNDLSLQQITRASEILEYDFVSEYFNELKRDGKAKFILTEGEAQTPMQDNSITTSLSIAGSVENYYKKFPLLIEFISEKSKELGFRLK